MKFALEFIAAMIVMIVSAVLAQIFPSFGWMIGWDSAAICYLLIPSWREWLMGKAHRTRPTPDATTN